MSETTSEPQRRNLDEVKTSWIATGVFGLTAFGADYLSAMSGIATVVALGLFVAGVVAMGATLVIAAGRSRTENIAIDGLFFLARSAPKPVQRSLMTSFAAQCVIGLVTAALRPYTTSAFGVLVPIAGIGLAGLWGARHGTFGPRGAA